MNKIYHRQVKEKSFLPTFLLNSQQSGFYCFIIWNGQLFPKALFVNKGFCSQFYYLNFSTQLIKDLSQQCSGSFTILPSSYYLEVDNFWSRVISAFFLHL